MTYTQFRSLNLGIYLWLGLAGFKIACMVYYYGGGEVQYRVEKAEDGGSQAVQQASPWTGLGFVVPTRPVS